QHLLRQDALRQIVDALEIAPCRGRDRPCPEEIFERALAVAPAPPSAAAAAALFELRCAQRTALGDLLQHRIDERALLTGEAGESAIDPFAASRAGHAPAHERMQLEREQGGLVAPILEKPSLAPSPPGR